MACLFQLADPCHAWSFPSTRKFWQDKIDKKPSKPYIDAMKAVNITLKAHKHIAKLNKQDMIFLAFFDVAGDVITITEVKRRNERTY
jgi:hypothetical protein